MHNPDSSHTQPSADNLSLAALNEERFRIALKHSSLILFNQDRELRYTWMRNVREDFLPEEVLGKTDSEILTPAVAEELTTLKRRVIETGESIRKEIKLVEPDRTRYFDVMVEPLWDTHGALVGLTGAAQDITSRIVKQQALIQNESRFRRLIEHAPDGIALLGADGKFLYNSPSTTLILGYSTEQTIGHDPIHDIHPDDREYIVGVLMELMPYPGKVSRAEYRVRDAFGAWCWIESTITNLLAEPDIGAYVFNYRNITERKNAEEEQKRLTHHIEQQFRLFNTALSSITDYVYILDRDARCVYANKPILDQHNITLDQAVGKNLLELGYTPEFSARFNAQLRQVFETRRSITAENADLNLAGEMRNYEYILNPVLAEDGTVELVCGLTRDITHRKQVELELREGRDRLRYLLAQQRATQTKIVQQERMAAVGQLAAGIAHDFNNILTPIMTYSELTQGLVETDSQVWANLQQIYEAAGRARDVVSQILLFSRQTTAPERRAIRLQPIISEVIKLLRAAFPSTLSIREEIQEQAGWVVVDGYQIHQVLMNLCINAQHAMRKLGGTLTLSLTDVELQLPQNTHQLRQLTHIGPGSYVCLSVSDTGEGMDTETLAHIFEPFFTTKTVGEGTGMGLAVVYGIVMEAGGDILVESEPGQGTTMRIYLPRAAEPEPQPGTSLESPHAELSTPSPNETGERILVVDDEPAIAQVTGQLLEMLGYRVETKFYSPAALQAFTDAPHAFDLVITDLTMPELTGMELATAIHALRPELPVVLTTGYGQRDVAQTAKSSGIHTILNKPFTVQDLEAAVRAALDFDAGLRTTS